MICLVSHSAMHKSVAHHAQKVATRHPKSVRDLDSP
jgi:hypothetical protein